jgi:acetyl-CoA carboxylase biotin carboxyl carrier protein
MIDIRKLKELVRLMVSHDLTEIDLRDKAEQVTIRRQSLTSPPQVVAHSVPAAAPMAAPPSAAAPVPAAAAPATPPAAEDNRVRIESPMVGTFYSASAPDKPPFIKVGDSVGPDTVVCIVEAMKVFNEIKAEVSGVVDEVLVRNGTPVEFGQPLFLLRAR